MIIYHFNDLNILVGKSEAEIDPLDNSNYLIPAKATKCEPHIDIPKGYVNVFNGDSWDITENHLGEIWFNKDTKEKILIDRLGEVPNYLTNIEPSFYDKWDTLSDSWKEDTTKKQVDEAVSYLAATDWVKSYLLEHKLGISTLPEDSYKFEIERIRNEKLEFIRANQ